MRLAMTRVFARRSSLSPPQERHLCCAIGAVVQDFKAFNRHRWLIGGPFPDADGASSEPSAGQEAAERLFAEALAIGWVQEGQIEGLTIACWLGPKIGAVAAMDAGRPKQAHRVSIFTDRASRVRIGLDE